MNLLSSSNLIEITLQPDPVTNSVYEGTLALTQQQSITFPVPKGTTLMQLEQMLGGNLSIWNNDGWHHYNFSFEESGEYGLGGTPREGVFDTIRRYPLCILDYMRQQNWCD